MEKIARTNRKSALVFSPILDTNESNARYRLAAAIGGIIPKLHTIQGEYRKQALGSDIVICRSRYEQEKVVRGLGVALSKTAIVLNGVRPPETTPATPSLLRRLRQQWSLDNDYLLHVSEYTSERKNVIRLAQAVGPLNLPLVIAGWSQPGPVLDRLKKISERYRNIRLLGFLAKEELLALYSECRVFCLPSLHEGTGLVALEAASYGANVVITRNGAPPDYFGRYAEYVDPLNVGEICEAVKRAWSKPRADSLRERVINELTWEESARNLLRTYRTAVERRLLPGSLVNQDSRN